MKMLLALSILFSLPAVAQSRNLLTDAAETIDHFFLLRSEDHKSVYYIPTAYTVDTSLSAVLDPTPTEIDISLLLSPQSVAPTAQELADWAGAEIAPYPSLFSNLSAKYSVVRLGFEVVQVTERGDGKKLVQIKINPDQIELREVLDILASFQPNESVHMYSKRDQAEAWISADYSAAATFVQNNYEERTCTKTEECSHFLVWGGCRPPKETCYGIERLLQQLQDVQIETSIHLAGVHQKNIPDSALDALEARLLSRLMLTLFTHNAETQMGSTVQIILGDLSRSASGEYHDHLTDTEIADDSLDTPVTITGLVDFLKPELSRIYDQRRKK